MSFFWEHWGMELGPNAVYIGQTSREMDGVNPFCSQSEANLDY